MTVKLPLAENISVKIEDSVAAASTELMTDSGDRQNFNCTGTYFSLCESDENGMDRRPVVRPDGVRNGFFVSPVTSGASDALTVYPGSAWIANLLVTASESVELPVTRPSASMMKIVSVILDSSGGASTLDGTEGSVFSESRGSAGGPPYIPAGKIELATVKLASSGSAKLTEDEVRFAPEFSHMPAFNLIGHSASVVFRAPLSAIHTGDAPRNVSITLYEPTLSPLDVISFTPPVVDKEIDSSKGKPVDGLVRAGSMLINLSADNSDIARRIAGRVRLIEFMPDQSSNRKEIFYAAVNMSVDYSPGGLVTGKVTLLPLDGPVYQTV